MYYKLFSIFFLVKPFFFIFGGQFKNKELGVDYSWASHTCYMSTYKPWFLAHTKNEHIIFPDEISAVSGTYNISYRA